MLTGLGSVTVKVPKVRDRSGAGVKFNSAIVPPYVRKAKRVEATLPWLYLRGISTGNMQDALSVLLGDEAKGLSPAVVSRLKAQWSEDYLAWNRRDLADEKIVYIWADGIYSTLRGEDDRLCLLAWVIINKYLDHLPLYRLEQIAARDGVILSRSTLADWVGRLGIALAPLVDRLAWHLLQRDSLHAVRRPYCNSIPARVKPRKPICGPIAVMICNRASRLSSSTIKPVAVAGMRSNFRVTGTTLCWLMTTAAAIKPCLPLPAHILNRNACLSRVSNWPAWPMRGANSSTCFKPARVLSRKKP